MVHFLTFSAIVFITGVVYESLCVLWDHYAGQDSPLGTAICAALLAGCQIFGLGAAINNLWYGLFFVTGCGIGAFFSIKGTEEFLDDETDSLEDKD